MFVLRSKPSPSIQTAEGESLGKDSHAIDLSSLFASLPHRVARHRLGRVRAGVRLRRDARGADVLRFRGAAGRQRPQDHQRHEGSQRSRERQRAQLGLRPDEPVRSELDDRPHDHVRRTHHGQLPGPLLAPRGALDHQARPVRQVLHLRRPDRRRPGMGDRRVHRHLRALGQRLHAGAGQHHRRSLPAVAGRPELVDRLGPRLELPVPGGLVLR